MMIRVSSRSAFGEVFAYIAQTDTATYSYQIDKRYIDLTLLDHKTIACHKLMKKYANDENKPFFRVGYLGDAMYLYDQHHYAGHIDHGEPVVKTHYTPSTGMMTVTMDGLRKKYRTDNHMDAVCRIVEAFERNPADYTYRRDIYKGDYYTLIEGWN